MCVCVCVYQAGSLSNETIFKCCTVWLLLAAACQHALYSLSKKSRGAGAAGDSHSLVYSISSPRNGETLAEKFSQ